MQPAIFLDRDNTLIANDGDLGRPDDVRLIQGVAEGLSALRDAGFNLVVVTNQAGVARGAFSEDDVDAVHQRIAMLVDSHARREGLIDRFYYCPYHPEGTIAEYRRDHLWRKPHPGMILQAARDMDIDLSQSWMIGDQERDIAAGKAAGCRTALVSRDAELIRRTQPTINAGTFVEAVQLILDHHDTASPALANSRPAVGNGQRTSGNGARTAAQSRAEAHAGHGDAASNGEAAADKQTDFAAMRRAIVELADEIRSDRMRRADFTLVRMLAGACQLLALLLALLGLLQLANTDAFTKWMVGAGLAQLLTITLLVLDLKG